MDDVPVICNTVVVNYFTASGRFDLLVAVLGGVVRVPTAVFDPNEDADLVDEALSELRRGMKLHERRVADRKTPRPLRERSSTVLPHFRKLDDHTAAGQLSAVVLTEPELLRYAHLRQAANVRPYGVKAALGRGEAAMLAIAEARAWRYATDDNDAIAVGRGLLPNNEPWRIRALLIRCVDSGLCSEQEARTTHGEMIRLGFWDKEPLR